MRRTKLPRGGVDLLLPDEPEVAFFGAAVTVGVEERLVDPVGRDAIVVLATLAKALGELEDHVALHGLRAPRQGARAVTRAHTHGCAVSRHARRVQYSVPG